MKKVTKIDVFEELNEPATTASVIYGIQEKNVYRYGATWQSSEVYNVIQLLKGD